LPLARLPVKSQESPVQIFDIAAIRALFVIAEVFIDHKKGNTAADGTVSVYIM
jgi:hypothetical protein